MKVLARKKRKGKETKPDDSIPDDEHVNDLERAFEILECAHMIYSKMLETDPNDAHIITRLGDLHVMLADVCNENGDHETALSHVLKAIELQETINEQQRYRLLAESYYKLGLIYELINKFSEAVDSFDKAIHAIRRAIEQNPRRWEASRTRWASDPTSVDRNEAKRCSSLSGRSTLDCASKKDRLVHHRQQQQQQQQQQQHQHDQWK